MTSEKKIKVEEVPVNVMIEEVLEKIEELESKKVVPVEEYVNVLESVKELDKRLENEKLIKFDVQGLKERLSNVEILWHAVDVKEAERILSLSDYDERLEKGINLLLEISKDPIGIALLSNVEEATLTDLENVYEELKNFVKRDEIEEELQKVQETVKTVKEVAEELKREKEEVLKEIKQTADGIAEELKGEVLGEVKTELEVAKEKVRELEKRISSVEADYDEINERVTNLTHTLNNKIEEVKKELLENVSENEELKILFKQILNEEIGSLKDELIGLIEGRIEEIRKELKESLAAERVKDREESVVHEEENFYEDSDGYEEEQPEETGEKSEESEKEDKKISYLNVGLMLFNIFLVIKLVATLIH